MTERERTGAPPAEIHQISAPAISGKSKSMEFGAFPNQRENDSGSGCKSTSTFARFLTAPITTLRLSPITKQAEVPRLPILSGPNYRHRLPARGSDRETNRAMSEAPAKDGRDNGSICKRLPFCNRAGSSEIKIFKSLAPFDKSKSRALIDFTPRQVRFWRYRIRRLV